MAAQSNTYLHWFGDYKIPATLSDFKLLARSKNLPDGVALNDLDRGFGSWEYFSRKRD